MLCGEEVFNTVQLEPQRDGDRHPASEAVDNFVSLYSFCGGGRLGVEESLLNSVIL